MGCCGFMIGGFGKVETPGCSRCSASFLAVVFGGGGALLTLHRNLLVWFEKRIIDDEIHLPDARRRVDEEEHPEEGHDHEREHRDISPHDPSKRDAQHHAGHVALTREQTPTLDGEIDRHSRASTIDAMALSCT